jgi:excinuclease ABC subunit A
LHTFANTQSALMKRRVAQFMNASLCPLCRGKRLRAEALSVKFAGLDIVELSRIPLKGLDKLLAPYSGDAGTRKRDALHSEKAIVVRRIAEDLVSRVSVLLDLGLGYLTLERSTPTLSPGELQRLRLATQVRSNLFGVVYGWMSPPPDYTRPTRKRCCGHSSGSRCRAIRCSSSSMNWT